MSLKNRVPDRSWTKKDFKTEWFSGSGAGGQHRNKHQNCLRLTHIESGIQVVAQNSRSRQTNMKDGLTRMADLLVEAYYGKKSKERSPETERVRTYHTEDNYVLDHKTNNRSSWQAYELDDDIILRRKAAING